MKLYNLIHAKAHSLTPSIGTDEWYKLLTYAKAEVKQNAEFDSMSKAEQLQYIADKMAVYIIMNWREIREMRKKTVKPSLKRDMKKLAKEVYELSKLHGGIYISAWHSEGHNSGMVTYGNDMVAIAYYTKLQEDSNE
jgi:hypothetical protein